MSPNMTDAVAHVAIATGTAETATTAMPAAATTATAKTVRTRSTKRPQTSVKKRTQAPSTNDAENSKRKCITHKPGMNEIKSADASLHQVLFYAKTRIKYTMVTNEPCPAAKDKEGIAADTLDWAKAHLGLTPETIFVPPAGSDVAELPPGKIITLPHAIFLVMFQVPLFAYFLFYHYYLDQGRI